MTRFIDRSLIMNLDEATYREEVALFDFSLA